MSSSSSRQPSSLRVMRPTEILDLGGGLTLNPRLKLLLTFFRSDLSVKPLDEWQLKRALLDFLRDSLSLSIPEEDLVLQKNPDIQKHKREDPVASGTLFVRDLEFLKKKKYKNDGDGEEGEAELLKRFVEWKTSVVSRMDGIDLNLKGVKFRLTVEAPQADDFDRLKKSWEEFYAWQPSVNRNSGVRRPDTILVKGAPSRWFAEPRVSSKPSMLVTHTIFSVLGKIRNLNVAAEDDVGKTTEDGRGVIASFLHCKIWIQFENYEDFCHALRALCGRSLQKEGSRLRADFEVTWDKGGFFRNAPQRTERGHAQERVGQIKAPSGHYKMEGPRFQSQHTRFDSDGARTKRFRE